MSPQLSDRFSMDVLFGDFCAALSERYPISRAGIVRSNLVDEEFEIIAQWYADSNRTGLRGRRIPREGTVGDWVLRHRRGFVGGSIDDVRRFPTTVLDFEEEGFQSNFVDFVDADRLLLFFALSAERDAFASSDPLREQLAVLPHCLRLAEHWESPGLQDSLRSQLETLLFTLWARFGTLPSQHSFDQAYYQALMVVAGGRIEGPGGAAELSGLKPSTLRSRMSRSVAAPASHSRDASAKR